MNNSLGNLKVGEFRSFTDKELKELQLLIAESDKTEEVS